MPNADESTNGDAAAGIAGAPSTITTSGGVGNDPVDNIIDHLLRYGLFWVVFTLLHCYGGEF